MKTNIRSMVLGSCVLGALLGVSMPARAATSTFTCTGYPQYFQVPATVTSLTFIATGAGGAKGSLGPRSGAGGFGGVLQGTLSVTPNEVLTIAVGCAPYKYTTAFADNRLIVYGWLRIRQRRQWRVHG